MGFTWAVGETDGERGRAGSRLTSEATPQAVNICALESIVWRVMGGEWFKRIPAVGVELKKRPDLVSPFQNKCDTPMLNRYRTQEWQKTVFEWSDSICSQSVHSRGIRGRRGVAWKPPEQPPVIARGPPLPSRHEHLHICWREKSYPTSCFNHPCTERRYCYSSSDWDSVVLAKHICNGGGVNYTVQMGVRWL